MKYLCRVRHKFNNKEIGEEVILTVSELYMWKKFVEVLKLIKEHPVVIYK